MALAGAWYKLLPERPVGKIMCFEQERFIKVKKMKTKIYITALHLQHGGVEMAISLLANAFVRRGYEVEILCIYNLGKPAYETGPGVKITYLTNVAPNREAFLEEKRKKNVAGILREGCKALKVLHLKHSAMKKAIRDISEGVVISTRNEHSVLLSKYGKAEVLKIAQLHHDHNFAKKYVNDFKKRYTNIDWFVALTEQLRDEVSEMVKDSDTKMQCVAIPNFLADEAFERKAVEKEDTVVTVGRLHPVKGFDRLLRIWKEVSENCGGWTLKIVGGGDLEEEISRKIKEFKMERTVRMMGMCSHDVVAEEMEKASVYVMASYSEAFPFVLIEAMAAELPVLAFDVRVGPKAIIKDKESGFLIKDGDERAFARRLEGLLLDKDKRTDMGRNAVHSARMLSESRVMEKWMDILKNYGT